MASLRSEDSNKKGESMINQKAYKEASIYVQIAHVVSEARKHAGLSQEELAEKSGIELSEIERIEEGMANPTVVELSRIANSLDLTLKVRFISKERA